MIEFSHDALIYLSESWGLVSLLGCAVAVLSYGVWPSRKEVCVRAGQGEGDKKNEGA